MNPSAPFLGGLATALLILPSMLLATPGSSQQAASEAVSTVDAAEAERRGLQAEANDAATAVMWFEQAARAGRPAAQWRLGWLYFEGKGVAADKKRALELMRAAAVQGLAPAQSFLGWFYIEGPGVERDPEQAFAWFSAAARQEDAYALRMLAEFYGRGVATKQDVELAKRLMLRAAELGDVDARRSTSALLMYGPAEQRNPKLAIHFLTKAAQANDAGAAYMLGREYLRGANVQHDPAAAAKWLQRAGDAGNALASLWLSELYFKGFGVVRDLAKAETLLNEALTKATISEKNLFAWDLSVAADERLRDGALALRVLEPALAAATEKVAAHVDTLAAAYAEVRQFDRAVVAQRSAIDSARRQRRTQEMVAGMEARLQLYERGEPYREASP